MARSSARYLGIELRRLREASGMKADRAAALLKWSPSKVSRYERARAGQLPDEVDLLLKLYKVPEDKRRELLDLAGKVQSLRSSHTPDKYRDPLAEDLDEAAELRDWSALLIPRVLQTRDYTVSVMSSAQGVLQVMRSEIAVSADETERWQACLAPGPFPQKTDLWAVFDESVLYRQVGTPEVMAGQLDHLLELASWPRVRLHMLPLDAGRAAMAASFLHITYAKMPGAGLADEAVALPHMHGIHLVEVEREIWQYGLVFGQLLGAACSEDETADAVKRAREERWSESG